MVSTKQLNYIDIFLNVREGELCYAVGRCITITILDIIHRPVFCLKLNVSETGFCLRLQVEPTQLCPVDRARELENCLRRQTSCVCWDQLSRLHLKKEQNPISETSCFK
jgi:hypothetical protein